MFPRLWIAPLGLLVGLASASLAPAQTPDAVRSALGDLKSWLGSDAEAMAWHKFLRTEDLERELARGAEADEVAVFGVLTRYLNGQASLDLPKIRRVRNTLSAWHATLKPVGPEKLADIAQESVKDLVPAAKADLPAARSELVRAVGDLASAIKSTPEDKAWANAIRLSALQDELKEGKEPDLKALLALAGVFSADTLGVERREFILARRALRRYIDLLAYATDAKSDERTRQAVTMAADDLKALGPDADPEVARRLGRALGYLRRNGQANRLVDVTRRHYCQPNLEVQVTRDFLAAGFEDPVDRVGPIRQVILGTDIHGTGHTVGRVHLGLVPTDGPATFETRLVADTATKTTGYNGPVAIYSHGVTHLRAAKRLTFGAEGLAASPASTEAKVENTIDSISANRRGMVGRFIERVAWKRAGEQEDEAQRIAASLAERQASEEVDRQANERIAESNVRFRDRFRLPLLAKDELPIIRTRTTEDRLFVSVLQANQDQLAATSAPPAIEGAPLLSVRLHESVVANFATASLGGETFTQQRLEAELKKYDQPIPDKLKPNPDEPAWSLTFARVDPISVSINDNGFKVTLRGQRYTSGDRTFQAMNVSAAYKIERSGAQVKLVRQGDLDISPPGHQAGDTLNAGQIALRRLLKRRFDGLFEPEIVTKGLKLGGKFEKLGTLTLVQLGCDNGWAALGWKTN